MAKTTLPVRAGSANRRWASAASSSGNVESITGRQFGGGGVGQERVELARAPHRRPLDPAPFEEHLGQVDRRRLPGGVAEADEDAAAHQRPDDGVEARPARAVDGRVDLPDPLGPVGVVVVDRCLGAELERSRNLGV